MVMSLVDRIDLVRQCTYPWNDQDVARLYASLPPKLLRSMMLSYINTHNEHDLSELADILATALPNILHVNYAGKLQTVLASS
jgi:hypothetical protein